jgi:hypothetical protein
MASISTTKWFTHAKTLECDKARRQCNWLFIRRLRDWVGLEAKGGGLYHQKDESPYGHIGVFKTSFKHHLMAFNEHSFNL